MIALPSGVRGGDNLSTRTCHRERIGSRILAARPDSDARGLEVAEDGTVREARRPERPRANRGGSRSQPPSHRPEPTQHEAGAGEQRAGEKAPAGGVGRHRASGNQLAGVPPAGRPFALTVVPSDDEITRYRPGGVSMRYSSR